jgi:predicted MFS family arabinose efflux permease
MLIVMRILTGAAAASVQAVGAGTVSDVWEPKDRGRTIGVFYLGLLCDPGLTPKIGGALTQNLGWRSTLWFLAIFGRALLALIIFLLPETLKHKTPTESADPDVGSTWQNVISGISGPPKVLLLI